MSKLDRHLKRCDIRRPPLVHISQYVFVNATSNIKRPFKRKDGLTAVIDCTENQSEELMNTEIPMLVEAIPFP